MKKILYILLLLFCIPFPSFGINGDGSIGSPYNGPLTANMTWSGTVYVNGDVTVNGFTLTISPASIIIFRALGSDIIITGTGVLTASGGSGSNMIRFTADFNNNGTYGESGERWGHISFQSMTPGFTNQSTINYCIIEFGQKNSSPFNFESAGGGLQTTYSFLTISNSIIRNNYAGWGGGIYINANASPSISNCIISNNTAGTTGGGISIYQYSAAILTNCIIEKNTCNGGGGGGGVFVGDFPDNVRIYNCVIASNVSTVSPGNNIRIWKTAVSSGPRIYNTIVWGNNSINYLYLGASVTDFNYCAIQGYTSGYTSCINLSGTNGDPTGPNFVNPNGLDYSISYISPCRDAGTSTGAPTTDYLGKNRIANYDIGAYEVQYSRWSGATSSDWTTSSNWQGNVDPATGTGDVYIPTGMPFYPTSSTTLPFTVGAGKIMTLEPGTRASFGTLTNNGTINLFSNVTGMFSLLFENYSGAGTINSQIYFTGGDAGTRQFRWHYIAVPASMSKTVLTNINQFNLLRYDDSRINGSTPNKEMGWQWHDGWNGTTTVPADAFATIDVKRGYDFYTTTPATATLTTTSLLSTIGSINLQYSGPLPNNSTYGWNLIGNSTTSAIDWNIVDWVGGDLINNAVYFTKDNIFVSYVDGEGVNGGTQFIPPLQGFFVQTTAAGQHMNFTGTNVHSGQTYYKGGGSGTTPQVRFEIWKETLQDETVVRFKDKATTLFDGLFDASKWLSPATISQIYTRLSSENYSINTVPFPETIIEIPVSVVIPAAGSYSIKRTIIQGLDNYSVTLTDNTTGFIADLQSTSTVSFSAAAGPVNDRFVLRVSKMTTGVENPVIAKNIFNVYPSDNMINIQTIADEWDGRSGSVKVVDLTGKTVGDLKNSQFSKNSLVHVAAPVRSGIYVVEIKSGVMRYVGKVVVR